MTGARKPCRRCGGEKSSGAGRAYCDACDVSRAKPILKGERPPTGQRRPCSRCGGEKPAGKGRRFCPACEKVGSAVPPETRRVMARLYVRGSLSVNEVARRTNWSMGCVHRALRAENVRMRPQGAVPNHPGRLTQDQLDETVELYRSGCSERDIGLQLGITASAVVNRLKRAGVERRTPSEGQRLARRRELEVSGKDALTHRQAVALECVERSNGGALTTEVATLLAVRTRSARSLLLRLEGLGLVRSRPGARKVGRAWVGLWTRTDLAVVDVLQAALAPPVTAAPPAGEEWLPIEPFREWLDGLIARERRLTMRAIKDVRDRTRGYAEEGEGAVAARLGISERRLYRLRHEQARVPFGTADACLIRSGEQVTMEDLWPHLAIREDAA